MYIIMVYDVHVERVARVLKIGRRYLTWIQNSVLEGELTPAQFARLKRDVGKVIHEEEDSVLFYTLRDAGDVRREQMGVQKGEPEWLV
ncbi:MAG: CRISPR-associated endoribonuclease Cas2 [Armatimonadota bacterium]|nr:MAG: CRISPR-associated endoribonuclease Cas2 [Armatimonadota bacterium]